MASFAVRGSPFDVLGSTFSVVRSTFLFLRPPLVKGSRLKVRRPPSRRERLMENLRTQNGELRTQNGEQRTQNGEHRTQNERTANEERRTENDHQAAVDHCRLYLRTCIAAPRRG
jgi:hypothetical protein